MINSTDISFPGKLDIDELKNTSLVKIQEYVKERLNDANLLRNAVKDQAWLWHDEDELLRYQPEIMGNFHERLAEKRWKIDHMTFAVVLTVAVTKNLLFFYMF